MHLTLTIQLFILNILSVFQLHSELIHDFSKYGRFLLLNIRVCEEVFQYDVQFRRNLGTICVTSFRKVCYCNKMSLK